MSRPDRDGLHRDATAMAATLVHRGPDAAGAFVSDDGHVAFGHRRLSVVDLSPHGSQPMRSRSGRWTLSFNGEIYNHRALRNELVARGSRFVGTSDTETLVEALDAWGIDATLPRLEGMFAISAHDTVNHTVHLVRDRLGEKPLYWVQQGDTVAFASELRALRALPNLHLVIDDRAAASMLRWGFLPHPHTIYRDVHQLSPGTAVTIDVGLHTLQVRTRTWWSLADTVTTARTTDQGTPLDLAEAGRQLEHLLVDAVSLRLESDVPLGAFLSGGIDSSLVAAMAQRSMGDRRLRTFAVSMPEAGLDEKVHAERVARHLGTDHSTIDLSVQMALDTIPTLPDLWDEPFADPSMLPTTLICRAAAEHVTVCLGGDGGDELFAGYNRHAMGASIDRVARRLPTPLRRGLGRMTAAAPVGWLDALGRMAPGNRSPQWADKVHKAGALLSGESTAWGTLAGVWPRSAVGYALKPAITMPSTRLSGIDELVLADTAAVLPDQMLVKVDRASMASSLEVRSPLLDTRLLEWSWRLPPELRTKGGVGKVVMRHLASQVLPPGISNRHKLGFDPPLAVWLRGPLRAWADDLLRAPRSVEAGWVDGVALRTSWRDHLSGRRNEQYRLWSVLMLEAWLQRHHPA